MDFPPQLHLLKTCLSKVIEFQFRLMMRSELQMKWKFTSPIFLPLGGGGGGGVFFSLSRSGKFGKVLIRNPLIWVYGLLLTGRFLAILVILILK